MSIERERLVSLIEFAKQSARLRSKFASSVQQYGLFYQFEHDLQDLPGIINNAMGPDSEDEIWFVIDRLHETRPPVVDDKLIPWILSSNNPNEEPKLTNDLGLKPETNNTRSFDKTPITHEGDISKIKALFYDYLQNKWRPWAATEKLRRKTIQIYSRLFTLKQQLDGSIVENPMEFLCGVGICIWMLNGKHVCYPLITRLVEITLNTDTAQIEIRPRDVDARIELDLFLSESVTGVPTLEKAAREFFAGAEKTFSPFDRGTYEPLLRTARVTLDPNGIYWPEEVKPRDRSLPSVDNKLKITDTWILFARPRSNNILINDLERMKKRAEETDHTQYPPAVSAIVTNPSTETKSFEYPAFRGVSSTKSNRDSSSGKPQDLFFPKAFNEEQVRIIQMLEVSDGVFVQGPPGTGKTHTIANVICHYLAQGKRVLVTSMKDPALAVLKDHLPEEIRPLTIALLSSEQDGMRQFEHAINKISSEIMSIDQVSVSYQIRHLENEIDTLHNKIAFVDRKINEWAHKNLTMIVLDDLSMEAQEAAQKVVEGASQYEFIPDKLDIGKEFTPLFNITDISNLREARRVLGKDIAYLYHSLPQLTEFPGSRDLLVSHQDISQLIRLKKEIDIGIVPDLVDSSKETYDTSVLALSQIESLFDLHRAIDRAGKPWAQSMKNMVRGTDNSLLGMLESLGEEIAALNERRRAYIGKPVAIPMRSETNSEFVKAVNKLSAGKSAFGIMGIFGKTSLKKLLREVNVGIKKPETPEDWKHVKDFISLTLSLKDFVLRWNTLAGELGTETVSTERLEEALKIADLHRLLKEAVRMEADLCSTASCILPTWHRSSDMTDDTSLFAEFKRILTHHIAKNRLANVWSSKERFQVILNGRSGPVIDEIRRFLAVKLGNPEISDTEIQTTWSAIMAELSRIHNLSSHLETVSYVCTLIEESGAPEFAELLMKPLAGSVDTLLPNSLIECWNLKRLSTYLDSIQAHDDLKKLAADRKSLENSLSKKYQEIIIKKTWLKLREKASPSILSALQAYLNAIQKIGKGTGKRAVRYRHDARRASVQANSVVPCWIMPHYRVSEAMPAELGCFDLVIVDEASQSDMEALPSLLRAKKILIVGDDKQVSPEGIGLEENKILSLMNQYLSNHVETYRAQMSPDRSIYDLFKVIFAHSGVMLKEHFRCVGPIIEYSKREFYNHELLPLRLPKLSEALDPPLIDVLVEDGYRDGDLNKAEVNFIVDEIKEIVKDPKMANRTIGVVSLISDKQAIEVWDKLLETIGQEEIEKHKITCGNPRTFQGKERDIVFLSMVIARNNIGVASSKATFTQRFNVAASRARDRMYLVRSVDLEHLSSADILRRNLITHFSTPYFQNEEKIENLRKKCESPFEEAMYDELTMRGYFVTPQVKAGKYRIDLVVEGDRDCRLAVECDGDKYHGIDKWSDDIARQRVLERAGWTFWRCFASEFIQHKEKVLEDLINTLKEKGIEPIGIEGAPRSVHTEHRRYNSFKVKEEKAEKEEESDDSPATHSDKTSFMKEDTPRHYRARKGKTGSLLEMAEMSFSEGKTFKEKETPSIKAFENNVYIEPGDIISYCDITKEHERITVRITTRPTNLQVGDLNKETPLAKALLGLEVGDEGYLIVPGNSKKTFRILEIHRPGVDRDQ